MNDLTERKPSAAVIARNELAQEKLEKDVARLKKVYRELEAAEQVVKNLRLEVADLEEAIEQGN